MTYYTSQERQRMSAAIRQHEEMLYLRERGERLCRLIYVAICIFIPIALFYVATN
jgi:hypothetical protein